MVRPCWLPTIRRYVTAVECPFRRFCWRWFESRGTRKVLKPSSLGWETLGSYRKERAVGEVELSARCAASHECEPVTVGARIVSECYSDLVLRIPWYVAWPLLIAFGALALHFVAVRSVYFPVRHPEGFWDLQAQLDGPCPYPWLVRRLSWEPPRHPLLARQRRQHHASRSALP